MDDNFKSTLDGKLLKGGNVKVGEIEIINYDLKFIFDDENGIGLGNYYRLLQPAVMKVADFKLEEILGDDMPKGIVLFDIACMFEDVREMFLDFFNVFTHYEWEFNSVFNEFVTYTDDEAIRITHYNIDDILMVIRKMYNVGHNLVKEEVKFRNKEAEEAMREFQEWEDSLPTNSEGMITLEGIIEGVTTKGTYDLFNIWDLTVYQLMRTFYKINDVEYIDNLTRGVYAGTVEGKALEGLHWANKTSVQ